jgi:XTP/dITP diphosphohydrolase
MDVYLASGNPHKFGEFVTLVAAGELPMNFYSAGFLYGGMPEVEETAATFEGNAAIKAEALVAKVPEGSWVLADDSGLCVDTLDGSPGVRSARYAGEEAGSAENNARLLEALAEVPAEARTARFCCVLVFQNTDGERHVFEGRCEGKILTALRGTEGFGYDPLFVPQGYSATFAELSEEAKNQISHRGDAVKKWLAFLRQQRESQPVGDKFH